MKTTDLLKDKLIYYKKPIIGKVVLQSIIDAWVPWYTIAEMAKRGLIAVLKKWSYYFNLESRDHSNPYVIGALYCEWSLYAFGGIDMYNQYGFTTQLPERYTIYNTTYNGTKQIGNYKYIFKQVRKSFFWDIETKKIDQNDISFLSPERALIQLVKEWWSNEFLTSKPKTINSSKLLELATKHVSKPILSNIKALLWKRK